MNQMDYGKALEKFLLTMDHLVQVDIPQMRKAVSGLCQILHIGHMQMEYYENARCRHLHIGQEMVLYHADDYYDKTCSVEKENVIGDTAIIIYMAFPTKADLWNEEIKERINLLFRMLYVFMSRMKLLEIADQTTYYDSSLQVHNLKYYRKHLDMIQEKQKLHGYAAVFFNFKHFSVINQQIGRQKGSFVMKRFLDQLISILSHEDEEILCRVGVDGFTALIRQEKLQSFLDVLRGTGIIYDDDTNERVLVTATAGVYVIPDDGTIHEPDDIMDKITIASHAARNGGLQDIVMFSEEIMRKKAQKIRIETLFPDAIEKEEFLVYYQPKIAMNTYKIAGAEALCRWKHEGKLISPADFIPVLEQSMDICTLDFYMLDHVCKNIRRWLDMGKQVVKISVNLSRRHMTDMNLLEHILEIIDRNHVPHEYIEIELTETTTDVEFKDLKRVVSGLQQTGISTSVDDFGIGYSSLNLIKEIPWNVLKVDKSFLPEEQDDYKSQRAVMFRHVIAMAQEMGLECIAEGVETSKQVDLLRENCCDLAQGFFFDKPLSVSD
ncbi:MAG: GGDEF domain-containing phosphodiesterase, partial [Oscillospiraceae bacterium]|nr:GGDEF domain-containing phosphodiesterase [Oscillospiraceae bacterium]